ncbi:MAE_28990/MAE_18760 family HEPN-like nuclease [Vibrio splendidus]
MNIRLSETQSLIDLFKGIESGIVDSNGLRMNVPVIRSTVILSLYNVIESTITQVLMKVHSEIVSKRVNYNNLTKPIKDLALIYFYKHKEKRSDIHNSLDVLHSTVDLIRGKGFFDVEYKEMSESYQLYSGNLDARIVRKIMSKYGVVISEEYGSKLKPVKEGRNKLAHGELSFEEYGRDLVSRSLEQYFQDVKSFLTEILEKTQKYLDDESYRINRKSRQATKRKRR